MKIEYDVKWLTNVLISLMEPDVSTTFYSLPVKLPVSLSVYMVVDDVKILNLNCFGKLFYLQTPDIHPSTMNEFKMCFRRNPS